MPTVTPAETRILIDNVRWETYVAFADDRLGASPRMTFSHGVLELMSPKKEHELVKTLLGRMVYMFCEEREIDLLSVGSTTFRRQDLGRGFEADESFYLQNADTVRSKEDIDLSIDPPPDLVIEVEITSPLMAKRDTFAAIGIPEVWRHNGQELTLWRLENSVYVELKESVVVPGFPSDIARRLLADRLAVRETEIMRQFRRSLTSK